MRGYLTLVIGLFVIAACSGSGSASTELTTSTVASTATTFANPFLDVVDEPSNFAAGDVVSVVGLPVEDKAWVGSFPAENVEFFGYLWPFERIDDELIATGEAASYQGGAAWEKVEQDGREPGYFPQERTGVLGPPQDLTLGVAELEAESADELLTAVAEAIAEMNGLEPIQISQREFGGREVYFDLIGGTDTKSRGQRLSVVVEESGESFGVSSVTSWIICVKAVDNDGACM